MGSISSGHADLFEGNRAFAGDIELSMRAA